jgi:serine/threonine protein kinase
VARPPGQNYRAPEGQLDMAGDVYAAGAVLYHLLTGQHPRASRQGTAPPPASRVVQGVPEGLDRLLSQCLHLKAEGRIPSAKALLDGLGSLGSP